MPKTPLEIEIDKIRGGDVSLTLAVYVRDHLDEILALHAGGTSYAALVEALGNLGVRDANGNRPNRGALYERVKAEKLRRGMIVTKPQVRPQIGRLGVKRKYSSEVL